VPSADFARYDHVLETACALGAIPVGYGGMDGQDCDAAAQFGGRGEAGVFGQKAMDHRRGHLLVEVRLMHALRTCQAPMG
jgi:5-methyltetrahydropteroyltriglutamate--homocysteine methyltransferase